MTDGKSFTRCMKVQVHYEGQRGKGVYSVDFEGLLKNVERRYRETGSETTKQEYETFMRVTPCHECGGRRLKKESLAVTVGEKNISELCDDSIRDLKNFMDGLQLTDRQVQIGKLILKGGVHFGRAEHRASPAGQ